MVEDVVTTGLSSREAMEAIEQAGGEVIAAAALVDRSGGTVDLGVPFYPLVAINFPTYARDELPPELAAMPAVKPGEPQGVST
jgi:orotate phosphoribosyltransferase